jgi:glycosyltransferase involved in cell wall biosynthesis
VKRAPYSILSLGRISASKNIPSLIKACEILKGQGIRFTADIYGNAPAGDEAYAMLLRAQVAEAKLAANVHFTPGVPNYKTPAVYSAHQIFVNLSPNGMYDKTIFEAMACGCFVFASNDDLREKIDEAFMFKYNDPEDLAAKLQAFFAMSEAERAKKASNISELVREHSLIHLADKLVKEIQ